MKVRLVEKLLKEGVSKEELRTVLELIGEAHNKIMEAQDELSSLSYDYDDDIITDLGYALDDLEAELSEYDFFGDDDPVQAALEFFGVEEEEEE